MDVAPSQNPFGLSLSKACFEGTAVRQAHRERYFTGMIYSFVFSHIFNNRPGAPQICAEEVCEADAVLLAGYNQPNLPVM